MKSFSYAALGLALLLGGASQARADDNDNACDAASLRGAFGYTVSGTTPANARFAAVGRLVFDGRGGVTSIRTLSNGGVIVRNDAGTGTYTVGSDCRGSFSIGATGLGQVTLDLVVTDGGKSIRAIATNPGFVLTLEGTKQ